MRMTTQDTDENRRDASNKIPPQDATSLTQLLTGDPWGRTGRGRRRAPERRCSSRTFRYGYLVTT